MWTEGRSFYSGWQLKLSFLPVETFARKGDTPAGFRLVLFEKGAGILQIGDQVYPITAPAVYCIHAQESMLLVSEKDLQARSVQFHPSVINSRLGSAADSAMMGAFANTDEQDAWYLGPFLERNEKYYGCIPVDPSIAKHIADTMQEMAFNLTDQPDKHWPCRSRSYLLELLFLLRRLYQKVDLHPIHLPNSEEMNIIKPIVLFLHTHYRNKIKLESLTSQFHINKTTLNHQFRKATGLSIIAYLNTVRMQIASSMLRNTQLPTSEIMDMVGFIDDGHFIRNFRKYTGCSPAEYRKKQG